MERLDGTMEERIWQRVLGQPGPEQMGEDLRPLMQQVQEQMGAYKKMWSQASGRSRELLRRLQEGERENFACLRGIQLLRNAPAPKGDLLPGGGGPARKILERCYHRSRRLMGEYTARSASSEFGAVFYGMAERQRMLCALVAETLGELGQHEGVR